MVSPSTSTLLVYRLPEDGSPEEGTLPEYRFPPICSRSPGWAYLLSVEPNLGSEGIVVPDILILRKELAVGRIAEIVPLTPN